MKVCHLTPSTPSAYPPPIFLSRVLLFPGCVKAPFPCFRVPAFSAHNSQKRLSSNKKTALGISRAVFAGSGGAYSLLIEDIDTRFVASSERVFLGLAG